MKKTIIAMTMATNVMFVSTASAFFGGGGGFSGAKEWTQISNKIMLGKQLVEQANMYKKQIEEFKTQVEQFDLEKLQAEVFDTGVFDNTLDKVNEYKGAFDLDSSKANIDKLLSFSELKDQSQIKSADFLKRLGDATNKNLELNVKQSEFTQKKMQSIQSDKQSLNKLQEANKSATGAMQAAQVGNHINSEIVAQMIKLRQEQAAQAQLASEKDAIENDTKAAKAAMLLQSFDANKKLNAARNSAPKSKHAGTPSNPFK